jgi:calcineurin-like phosphoesterase family protein
MATWWTSDTHFSHANIIRYCDRPFASVEEMNAELTARWNDTVAPDDEVWHLGDLVLGQNIEAQIERTAVLAGVKRLVPGNHDRVARSFEGRTDFSRFAPLYRAAGWEIMPELITHTIGGHEVLVCHFPYAGDSHARDRYDEFRPVDHGLPIIHGHVHNTFAELGRQFNVGVDVRSFRPVPEESIRLWLDSLPSVE